MWTSHLLSLDVGFPELRVSIIRRGSDSLRGRGSELLRGRNPGLLRDAGLICWETRLWFVDVTQAYAFQFDGGDTDLRCNPPFVERTRPLALWREADFKTRPLKHRTQFTETRRSRWIFQCEVGIDSWERVSLGLPGAKFHLSHLDWIWYSRSELRL